MVTGLINKRKISIAVADDSPIIRQMLSLLIEKDERFRLVGVFEDGSELISNIKEMSGSLSVCLLDIMMPQYNGIETAGILQVEHPELLILDIALSVKGHWLMKCIKMVQSAFSER